ncbi:hypothetical protein VOLCADRAFT_93752 [Volvox carteri f. nagariensis]|uniref:Uncharacterized protein n=1 Tax=Volvox carteri f. nagariensis TaxID=3068 RepID=D8U2Z1_VOLCA|nr:uncharacterized protein VOLCADRAFT_93752 [Volvox carteri f. nagariensis]EFJ45985.1 hypothetical protein VOLCADRAFT_93752 [Volvox carteri f. nagariensis]|eukprot:XP_002953063.1 hypothetical protein VOLCADRAFT_93752 [Volvox carteri f. nagariensis]
MKAVFKPRHIVKLLSRRPEIFTTPLEEWYQFLAGVLGGDKRGAADDDTSAATADGATGSGGSSDGSGDCNIIVAGKAAAFNTPYNAGAAIMFFKSYGWTDQEVIRQLLPCYPEVLAATPEELQATVHFLRSRKFDEQSIRRMVLEFPLLFAPIRPTTTNATNAAANATDYAQQSLLQLIDRIRASAHNKYVVSGSYHV